MLLFPGKPKFRKSQKQSRRFKGFEVNYSYPKRGFYGLKALGCRRFRSSHIEAVRRYVQRRIKRKMNDKLHVSVFPDMPVTRKSSGIRMGKGKGAVEYWCTTVFTGRVLFELGKSLNRHDAVWSFLKVSPKLPFPARVVVRKKFHVK